MADRILTTHVGSLPRSAAVTDLVFAQERADDVDPQRFDEVIGAAELSAIRAIDRCSGCGILVLEEIVRAGAPRVAPSPPAPAVLTL